MNGENQNNNQSSQVPPPPQSFGGTPPAPPSGEIKIRTMESDVKSVEESGGGVPESQVIRPEELGIGETTMMQPSPPPSPSISLPTGDVSREQNLQSPVSSFQPPVSSFQSPAVQQSRVRPIWWFLLTIVVVVALGVAGWVYVRPLILLPGPPPMIGPVPENVAEEVVPEAALPPPAPAYESFFGFSADKISVADVDNYRVISVLAALQNIADSLTADGQSQEVALNVAGQPARFSSYLVTLLPELERTNLAAILDADFDGRFAVLLYRQSGQVWPVYAVRRKQETAVTQTTLLSQLPVIESASIGNLYLIPPTGKVSFKTGPVGDKYTSRYASFENKPASFNYGLFGNYLILSATYQGLTTALELLGL